MPGTMLEARNTKVRHFSSQEAVGMYTVLSPWQPAGVMGRLLELRWLVGWELGGGHSRQREQCGVGVGRA